MNKRRAGKNGGFTLVEIIIVVSVIVILAAIAIPVFIGITQNARDTANVSNAVTISIAINAHNNLYADDADSLISSVPADSEALKSALGNMYPQLPDADAEAALELITITDNVASVDRAN
jgi:prepilin-type N-terminal cleavage/methylation domain-containing protein